MIRKLFLAAILLIAATTVDAATLYVTEITSAPPTVVVYQAARMPAVVNQTVAIGVSSTQSTAFDPSTGLIRVHADVACHVVIGGTNPTATVSSMRMIAGQTEYFTVKAGDKLAVIIE